MAKSYPIIERIARAIKAAVESVKESAGYPLTITSCTRPKGLGLSKAPGHLEAVLMQGSSTDDDGGSFQGVPAIVAKTQPFTVFVAIRLSDSVEESFDEVFNVLGAALSKALRSDRQWGGLAIDTEYSGPEIQVLENGCGEGLAMVLDVNFRTPENDAYTNCA